ncbi:MAG: hypothetical protein ACXVY5_04485 [Gaiellales bacterium]
MGLGLLSLVVLPASLGVARADSYHESLCQERPFLCLDKYTSIGANGAYTGHDEPTVEFISNRPGTGGKQLLYYITLPKDASLKPNQAGTGGTWDFQRRATFWLGITMCDTESSPNFRATCRPNSDANARFRSSNPNSPDYIGKSPGNAFMELQFYTPGWVPQFAGFGCSATKWCANMTIDSLSDQDNTGVSQNADCLNNHFLVGEEPINWAYITRSGRSQAPANPLALSDDPNVTGLNPDLSKDLLMNPGDRLRVFMHDTPAGYRVDITDLTTGRHGSMTASIANGFGHVLFQPNATHCHVAPYAFHPMYSSAVPRGTTWGAHTTNVGFSDEIGHFEYCNAIDANGACTTPGAFDSTLDVDDQACLDGSQFGALIPIIGCLLDDGDFDGPSYRLDWPGTFTNHTADRNLHGTPVQFTVPVSGGKPLEQVAFETDLPRIERGEPGNPTTQCDAFTGRNCVNPPPGARFYPLYTLTQAGGLCMFQQGGAHVPGTTNTFGGTSRTEYGQKVLFVTYPNAGFKPITLAEDFRRALNGDPCR